MSHILIVDDEVLIRDTLVEILELEDYKTSCATNGKEAIDLIENNHYDLVLCDIKMPKVDGMQVLEASTKARPDLPVIMISGHGNMETAVEATKKGAYDFIAKPPDLERMLITIRNAIDKAKLVNETKTLKQKVSKTKPIIGNSPQIEEIKQTIEKVGPTDARVLITGDNGTGKELVAHWLHEHSSRAKAPLVEVNCAAIPPDLIESELFGHEKGAFTSAIKKRKGKFEQAQNGTLFLDEIGDMSLSAQAKVLRALQESKITPVGSDKVIEVNVRVVAATNKDLQKEIKEGRFREDLFHRLSVIIIHVPPLNERTEDIPALANHFLKEICSDYGMPIKKFEDGALEQLKKQHFTGNIRELRNVIERLIILSGQSIGKKDIEHFVLQDQQSQGNNLQQLIEQHSDIKKFKDMVEKAFIEQKLKVFEHNITKAAEHMGMQRSQLYSKIEKFDLKK